MSAFPQLFLYWVRMRHYYQHNGLAKTIGQFFKLVWLSCFRTGMVVYYCDLKDETTFTCPPSAPLTFVSIAAWEELPVDYIEKFSRHYSPLLTEAESIERLRQGASFWAAREAGNIAGFGWSLVGKTREPYFFHLRENDVHFFDFFVLPEYRGRGINRALVCKMLNSFSARNLRRAYIETNVWNITEQASLRKTPFVKLGTIRRFSLFGRVFVWWSGGKPAALGEPVGPSQTRGGGGSDERSPEGDSVSLTQVRSFESIQHLRDDWDRLVLQSSGDIYTSFDWCSIFWKHYGGDRRLQILLFHSGGRLVGVVPMFTETVWLGLSWVKVARIIGSDFGFQVCNLPVDADFLNVVCTSMFSYFCESCGCDAIILSPLSQCKTTTEKLRKWGASAAHASIRVIEKKMELESVFSLPATFDDFLKQIGKGQRGNYKRDCNLLAKSFRFTTDVVTDPAMVEKEFASFEAMHQAQWRAERRLGHFGDWPRSSEFNANLVSALAAKGQVRLYRLLVDEKPVSYQYCFLFNQCLYWRLCSRLNDEPWKRYGLGRMGLFKMIELAMAEGVREIEAGRGHYGYKANLGAKELEMVSLTFLRKTPGSTVRYYVFRVCSKAVNVLYYKILFKRVYPRFPFLRRPLAGFWIRTRL